MIDHVTIRVDDLDACTSFYSLALELLEGPETFHGDAFVEWSDFSVAGSTPGRLATRGLHVAFQTRSREAVDEWWTAMTRAGYADDGAPGPRLQYGPTYYGAFVLDPEGNCVEAVHRRPPRDDGTVIDHLWLRVADLAVSTRFYAAVAPAVGHRAERLGDRTMIRGDGASFSVVEGTPSANVHLAFGAPDRESVDRFHEAGLTEGLQSRGAPGERPQYHPGYYGAYLADPDGNVIEAVFHDR